MGCGELGFQGNHLNPRLLGGNMVLLCISQLEIGIEGPINFNGEYYNNIIASPPTL